MCTNRQKVHFRNKKMHQIKSHPRESCTTSVSHIYCQSIHRNLNPGKIVFCDIKRQYDCLKCPRASVSHQLPSSCRSGVIFSLVSDSIAAIYQSMGPLFRRVSSIKLSNVFVFYLERLRGLFGSLSAGCCCRLNGKNLQMFEICALYRH